jgi:tetratricopeptide (TPR) repeat protein
MEEIAKSNSVNIAWDYYRKGEIENAIKTCNSLIKVKKYFLGVNYLLGIIYYDKRNFNEALICFELIVNSSHRNKENGYAEYWIGLIFNYEGYWLDEKNILYDKIKAKEFFLKSKNFKIYPADVILQLAKIESDNFEKTELYKEGIEKFKGYYDFYIKLAKLYKAMGYESKQYEIFELAVSNKLESSSLFFNIAEYHYENKDMKSAIHYLNKCSITNTRENAKKLISFTLGKIYSNVGNLKKATLHFNTALKIGDFDADNLLIILGLILINKKQNEIGKSISLIKKIPLDKDLFELMNLGYGVTSYLDGDDMERTILKPNPEELIKALIEIKEQLKDSKDIIKIDLILYSFYDELNDNINQLKILKNHSQVPNGFEFIGDLLARAYDNFLTDFNKQIINFFIEDIEKPFFDTEAIIEKVVKNVFDNRDYNNVVKICEKVNDRKKK